MATPQITILKTNARPDGSFTVSGVFWLTPPTGNVVPDASARSLVVNVSPDVLTMLRAGNLVETTFTSGLFIAGTDTQTIQSTLQGMYASAQSALDTQSSIQNLVGTSFDGTTWNSPVTNSYIPHEISPQYTKRTWSWSTWKAVQLSKSGIYQSNDDGTTYTVWFYDGPEVHVATIWKGVVPANIAITYSQLQNDSDKADFETNYLSNSNKVIDLKTIDGRVNVAPNSFPSWVGVFFTGRGDDPDTQTIGVGPIFTGSLDTTGDVTVSWKFIDTIYVLGGILNFTGAEIGDTVDYYITAPPTATGDGLQQVVLSNIGPGNIIVPVPSGGSTVLNISGSVVPVPNYSNTGFWDWIMATTGPGTLAPNYNQTGTHDLFDFTIPLAHLINQVPIVGNDRTMDIIVESVTSKELLPQWVHTATIHNGGHSGLRVGWTLVGARARTF